MRFSLLGGVLGVACLACGAEPPTDPPHASRVRHLVERDSDVLSVDGVVRTLAVTPRVVVEAPRGADIGGGLLVVPLPWPPRPGTLEVEDTARRRIAELPLADLPGAEQGFAVVPTRQRVDASALRDHGGAFVPERGDPASAPAHVRLTGSGANIVCNLPLLVPGGSVRVHARSGGDAPARLSLAIGADELGSRSVPPREWSTEELRVESQPGLLSLEVRSDDPLEIAWLELVHDGPALLIVRGADPATLRVAYDPLPPRVRELVHAPPAAGASMPALGLGGEIELTPLDGVGPSSTRGETRVLEPASGLVSLSVSGTASWFELVQPLARLLPQALDRERGLRAERSPAPAPDAVLDRVYARSEIGGERRAGFWLPCPSSLSIAADLAPGDRLRFAVGSPADPPGALRYDSPEPPAAIRYRVMWTLADGEATVLDEVSVRTDEPGWVPREVEIPDALAGRGALRFETTGPRPLPAAFADPRIVPARAQVAPPPNVLVYLIDTLRADHLSCYGARNPTSPSIDALAADGFRFDAFHAVAPWTRPTTASVLTGYYPEWHGMGRELPLPRSLDTLAESFAAAGYSTWAAVANAQVSGRGLRFEQGFHRFAVIDALTADGSTIGARSSSARLNDAVLPWLEDAREAPFLLYVHSLDPHSPYAPPPDAAAPFGREYEGRMLGEPLRPYRLRELTDVIDERDLQYIEDVYDNEVLHQDAQIGVLLDALEVRGLLANTIVVVLSDHGEEFLEHGNWNHGYRMWQEQLIVPLVVWVPPALRERRGLSPRVIATPLSQVDFLPGLLDLAGVSDRFPRQGRSWLPLLSGAEAPLRPPYAVDWQTWEGDEIGAFRHGRYKLVWTVDEASDSTAEMLFDLDADPLEQTDLAAALPELVTSLRAMRDALREESAAVRARLDAADLGHVAPAGDGGVVELDPHAAREIEALGYVGDHDD